MVNVDEDGCMSICAVSGTRIECVTRDSDDPLEIGLIYTVVKTGQSCFSAMVQLKEFPGKWFPCRLFRDIPVASEF